METDLTSSRLLQNGPATTTDDSGTITYKDLEEIRTLKNPPDAVRRTLEVTCIIIATSTRPPKPEPPAWSAVQRKLGDAQFLSQVLSCDPASLRAAPAIMSFIAMEYFCTGSAAAISSVVTAPAPVTSGLARAARVSIRDLMSRSGSEKRLALAQSGRFFRSRWKEPEGQEPLSIDRVLRASITAVILLRWSVAMLEIASAPAQILGGDSSAQAALDKIKTQVVAPLAPPRLLHDPIPPLSLQEKSPRLSGASPPSSYRQSPRQRPSNRERLQPLQLNHSSASSSSAALGTASKSRDAPVAIASVPFLIDRATEKVQSLALAKIEGRQRSARSAGKERMQPLPLAAQSSSASLPNPVAKRQVVPEEGEDEVITKAREMMRRRAEEKANLFDNCGLRKAEEVENTTSDATAGDAEEYDWRSFHASYVRAEEQSKEPEKVADKTLKKMEIAMKDWEERMKKGVKSDVEVTRHDKLLEGGFLETAVCFSSDSNELTEKQEAILRIVAATVRMREKLRLQLIGSGMELDGPMATMRRLCNVQQFFESDGVPCNAVHAVSASNNSFIRPNWLPSNSEPRYVLCRLHMNSDMELCGHLLGTLCSSIRRTREQAAWLKSNFEVITY